MYYPDQREYIHEFDTLHKLLTGKRAKWDVKGLTFTFENFSQAISKLAIQNEERDFLEQSARLRNFIQHNQAKESAGGALPTNEFINRLRDVREKFEQSALDYASMPVYHARRGDNVQALLELMNEKQYTNVPVLCGTGLLGVFSHHSYASYAAKNLGSDDVYELNADMLSSPFGDGCEVYRFASRDAKFIDVYKFYHEPVRLGAVFITETGSVTEPIEGIVTPWDLNFR